MEVELSEWMSQKSVDAIEVFGKEPPPTLLILVSPLVGLALNASRKLALGWVSEHARLFDVKEVVPLGDRWSVSEVQESIMKPSDMVPVERNFIIVEHADEMDIAASEKLLKTVEEPSTPTTFIFCVSSDEKLLTTLKGRARATVELEPASAEFRANALSAKGITPARAARAVELSGNQVKLASLVALDDDILEAAEVAYNRELDEFPPLRRAEEISNALSVLANVLVSEGSRKTGKVDTASRPALRILAKDWLNRERKRARADLRSDDRKVFQRAFRTLSAADDAEREINLYAQVPLVIAAFLSVKVGD